MDRTRPDQIINDPVMGVRLKNETSPTSIANLPTPARKARNYSLNSGQVACEWSVKDAASPNGVVLEVVAIVAVPHWRCRSAALHTGWSMITTTSWVSQPNRNRLVCSGPSSKRCSWPGTGTRPRIAGEALAVTARTKCSHQTKSLGRRDGGLQSFLLPRALVFPLIDGADVTLDAAALSLKTDAQVSQKLELKRRGEPDVLSSQSIRPMLSSYQYIEVMWRIQYNSPPTLLLFPQVPSRAD
ncbi:hypothetical protein BO83DRAFT_462413 [Aspergillus eucalypticola CBS 122712]|uniref:Uncharacterized protein n=1 Tax=Aspergillus eucalypticola (strain CBS 122712 / IBT 29274) TaxID=1448314 RepID=A0A317VUU5_ASPEC|nr:uncharacterized protein BO83DRAFT_462413 [Aspergillus eucalypticola CBS 122712]PWY76618.1 hypothetical protein BO83DRAFT_462413 [Aspergillus eucalypticola CBS 122712]